MKEYKCIKTLGYLSPLFVSLFSTSSIWVNGWQVSSKQCKCHRKAQVIVTGERDTFLFLRQVEFIVTMAMFARHCHKQRLYKVAQKECNIYDQ